MSGRLFFGYASTGYYNGNNMLELRVRKFGNSLGVILPKAVIERLHTADGQKLFLTESPGDGYQLRRYDPEFERQMQLAEEGMIRYRNTLHILAK